MRTKCAALLTCLACCGNGVADPIDKEGLRKLVAFPTRILYSLVADPTRSEPEKKPTQQDIDGLLKQMKGDARDAERYSRLAENYIDRDEWPKAKEALATAVRFYREQLKKAPKDGHLHARLSDALDTLGEDESAEQEINAALRYIPLDAECWSIRAHQLADKALFQVLNQNRKSRRDSSLDQKIERMMASPPSPQQLAQALRCLEESRKAIDKAVELDPKNAAVYGKRIHWRLLATMVAASCRKLAGEKVDVDTECANASASRENLRDVYRRLKLRELNDPKAVYMRIVLEVFFAAEKVVPEVEPASTRKKEITFADLPEENQRAIRKDLRKLRQLMDSRDVQVAAAAAEAHGFVLLLCQDFKEGEKSLRRAVALNPSKEETWYVLVAALSQQQRHDDALKAQRELLKHKDTPRNRFLLAQYLNQTGQSQHAYKQLHIGLRIDPNDFWCNLGLASLLMKRDDAESLKQAAEHLDRAKADLDKKASDNQRTEYRFLRALHAGLSDRPEEAKKVLQNLLSSGKSEEAKKALTALGD